jgi:hypothetical protein
MFSNISLSFTCSVSFYLLSIFTLFCQLWLTSYFWRNLMYHNKYTRTSLYIYIYCVSILFYFCQNVFQMTLFLKFPLPKAICNSLVILRGIWFTQIFHFFFDHTKILWAVQITKLLIVVTPPFLCFLVPLNAKRKNIFWNYYALFRTFNLL